MIHNFSFWNQVLDPEMIIIFSFWVQKLIQYSIFWVQILFVLKLAAYIRYWIQKLILWILDQVTVWILNPEPDEKENYGSRNFYHG